MEIIEPIGTAVVDLYPMEEQANSYREFTDGEGHFSIEDIPAGRYRLRVTRVGYLNQEYGADSPGSTGAILSLSPGKRIVDLVFRMIPAGVITGRISDESGQPLTNAAVVALKSQIHRGRRKLSESLRIRQMMSGSIASKG